VELIRHFDLDGVKLNDIVNAGVGKGQEIDEEDLHLIAMAGLQQSYAKVALGRLRKPEQQRRAMDIDDPVNSRLRSYLVSKYVPPRTVPADGVEPS
jgi:diadenosine tetraphosphate (Ap4A) HIT family hydrolase